MNESDISTINISFNNYKKWTGILSRGQWSSIVERKVMKKPKKAGFFRTFENFYENASKS